MSRWIITLGFAILSVKHGISQLEFASLAEVLAYADKHSVVARQKNLQAAITQQEIGIARSGLLPKILVFGAAEYAPILPTQVIPESAFGGQDGKFRTVQFGMPWNLSNGLEFSMPLINLEKWAQLETARLQALQSSWAEKARVENLHIQLTQWYYQALLAKTMVRLNDDNLKVVAQLMKILEERKKNGVLDPADYNRSRNLEFTVATAQLDYQKSFEHSLIMLRSLLNIPERTAIKMNDSITSFSWLTINGEDGIHHRAAWHEAVARTAVARQSLVESQKATLPKLSLSSRYAYNWQMNNSQNIHFDMNTVGIRVDYPLFNGDYHNRQQKKNQLVLQHTQLYQKEVEASLTQQQLEWQLNYSNALSKKNILRQKTIVATDNLRIATLNMKEGVMEFEPFNNIFSEYVRARIEEIQNLSDGLVFHLLLTNKFQ